MGNNAVMTNPPPADIHITAHGSDWLWAAFSLFALFTLIAIAWGGTRPATDRLLHFIVAAIGLSASLTYFTIASDLGSVGVPVEFHRSSHHVLGAVRQVFYARYINWFIISALISLALFLTSGFPWQRILFVIALGWFAVINGLAGALISTRYKWGYFTMGLVAVLYIIYSIILPGRRYATSFGNDVHTAFSSAGLLLILPAILYPICWGVSEGGNVIAPDSEAVFYGILDLIVVIGFGTVLLFSHRNIEPSRLGLRMRGADEGFRGGGSTTAPVVARGV